MKLLVNILVYVSPKTNTEDLAGPDKLYMGPPKLTTCGASDAWKSGKAYRDSRANQADGQYRFRATDI
jgi:hypothetical protein